MKAKQFARKVNAYPTAWINGTTQYQKTQLSIKNAQAEAYAALQHAKSSGENPQRYYTKVA